MPDSKISALPSATVPLAGTEVLPIVQSGTTDKVTAADILRQNGQTVTTSNPVLSLAQTWNAGGVAFTGLRFNATDTASAAASLLLDLQVGGSSIFKVDKTGIVTAQSAVAGTVGWFQSSVVLGSLTGGDTILTREAADTLALRNGTNAQTFRVYNTYTDASNYERGVFDWSTAANALTIGTQKAGTGATRVINFSVGNAQRVQFGAASATLDVGLIFGADNTYDIGQSGATRPRNVYAANAFVAGGGIDALSRMYIYTGTAIPAGGTTGAGYRMSSTANFGVFFGSGAPTLSAAKGSLYLRSDGSGTGDRMYVNTDSSTTWTAVTTAA